MDREIDYAPVVFISGYGRTGTNVLKNLLGAHSMVATLPFEHRFTIDPGGVVDFYLNYPQAWSPYRAHAMIYNLRRFLLDLAEVSDEKAAMNKAYSDSGNEITPPPYNGWELERWMPGFTGFVHDLITDLSAFEYKGRWPGAEFGHRNHSMHFSPPRTRESLEEPLARFLNKCTQAVLTMRGKSHFVEDNTHSLFFAESLLRLAPRSKLLVVHRDAADHLASLAVQRWTPSEKQQLLEWYNATQQQWTAVRQQIEPSRYREIQFETLMANPAAQLKRIFEFIHLPSESVESKVDLSAHNMGRWKEKQEQ